MKRLPSAVPTGGHTPVSADSLADGPPTGGELLGAEIAVIADRLERLLEELEADVRERSRFLRTDVPDRRFS